MLHFGRLDVLVKTTFAHRLADARCHSNAQIRLDEDVLEIIQHGGIEPPFGENIGDALTNGRGRARQAGGEALPPALSRRECLDGRRSLFATAKEPAEKAGLVCLGGVVLVARHQVPNVPVKRCSHAAPVHWPPQ